MSNPNTITVLNVASANLFQLAAQFYGDATQWNRVASLNGVWDFALAGLTSPLQIPAQNSAAGNGGILGI